VDKLYAHDVKLEADRLSEQAAFAVIRSYLPDAPIMSEETGIVEGQGDFVWIVDPLDGTMNYFHRQHHFCACVACYRRGDSSATGLEALGKPVAGAVYAASYDELFCSKTGGKPTLNGEEIRVAEVDNLADAIVTTSFGSKPEVMDRMERIVHNLLRKTRKIRIQGSCGLDICAVAAGRLSALYQADVRCWDFAAARVVLEAAGGKLDAVEVAPNRWNVLACAPGIFEEMKKIVSEK
jgi:fructose-1,6-bisphosphatase/inositol monophosphatase family enzyme